MAEWPARDERGLIAAFLAGEPGANAEIESWLTRAAASFRRRLGPDWEDALQEVRLESFRLLKAGAYRHEARLKTYLWRVVSHTCIDALRRRARQPLLVPDGEGLDGPSPNPSPLDEVARRESAERLLRVLAATSRECRELWGLILQGLSYREIARRVGASEGALRVRALRCRKSALRGVTP